MPRETNSLKVIASLICTFIISSLSYAQNIAINYYSTGTGQNITANYSINIKKNEIGFGLGYNTMVIPRHDDQNNVYLKKKFAIKPIQHLNLNIFYHRFVFTNLHHLNPFIF